ncbi:cupin [Rhodobacteraceae bacterium 2CG4]|uniref:Cupin n=1 Tax=Halovulum marinum TaxID=2662447 RepID=A0A6L5YW35_9RHOB|nr:cupin [Halovulum marinum]MSU88250.1 cupin [Halovulum marinum]
MTSDNTEAHILYFAQNGSVPNNPSLPVMLLRGAFTPGADCAQIRHRFARNGWGGAWAWRIFDHHHYHLSAHEALVVRSGAADLLLGGPGQQAVHLKAGDALVLPAGTGRCRIAATGDFQVCGAYAPGQDRSEVVAACGQVPRPGDRDTISSLRVPAIDPLFGADGPLAQHWRCSAAA